MPCRKLVCVENEFNSRVQIYLLDDERHNKKFRCQQKTFLLTSNSTGGWMGGWATKSQ